MHLPTPKSLDLNAREIALAAHELDRLLAGRRISRFAEASETCLLWQAPACDAIIDCTPDFVHLCAASGRPRGGVSPFTMLLRKHIGGTPIARIAPARAHDRVVQVDFVSGLRIFCELTGRHANVFLVDAGGFILGSFFPPHSVTRPLHPGASYTLPPEPSPIAPETSRFPETETSAAIDAFFTQALREHAARRAHHAAATAIRREITRLSRLIERLGEDAAANTRREQGRIQGEFFLQAIPFWPEGLRTFAFTPYTSETPVELTLPDACRTPAEAAQWHFKQYKKSLRAAKIIQERISLLEHKLQQQNEKLQQILAIEPEKFQIPDLPRPPAGRRLPDKRPAVSADDPGIRRFTSSDGFLIRIGKSAADNHRLTFQIARGEDLWLHARDVPGAHVVISCPQNGRIPETTLQEAAMLALFYSDARREGHGYVHVVPRKWVRPVPRRTGEVTLSGSKSLYVVLDDAALARFFPART